MCSKEHVNKFEMILWKQPHEISLKLEISHFIQFLNFFSIPF